MRRPDRFQWPIVQVVPSEVPCRRLCAHSGTPVPVPDTWTLSPPDKDQNTSGRRLPLVWRRCIHAATDTVVRRPHGRLPGDRLARLDLLARRRLAEEAPGHTAPKLRGAHARNSAQGVLMRRHCRTLRTPDVTAPPRPMVRNAPRGARAPPAWRPGTNFFKQNYPTMSAVLRPLMNFFLVSALFFKRPISFGVLWTIPFSTSCRVFMICSRFFS